MKKLQIILLLIIFFQNFVNAQSLKIGIESGLNNSTFYETVYYGRSKINHFTKNDFLYELIEPIIKKSFIGGFVVEKPFFDEKLIISSKILFTDKSVKVNFKDDNYIAKSRNYYLSIPLNIGIKIYKPFYWKLGFSYNFLFYSDLENTNTYSLYSGFSIKLLKNLFIDTFIYTDFNESQLPYFVNDGYIIYKHFYYSFGISLSYFLKN